VDMGLADLKAIQLSVYKSRV